MIHMVLEKSKPVQMGSRGRTIANLPPLGDVDRLNDPGNLIDKGDGSRNVVQHLDIPDLLPGHGHVLQQLKHRMRHVL